MTTTDLAIEILKQIRDGVSATNAGLERLSDELREEIAGLRTEVAGTNQRLDRVEQGLTDLGTFMRAIAGDQARHEKWLTKHVERELDVLKARVARVESATGLGTPE